MNLEITKAKRLFMVDLGMTIQYGHNLGFLKVLPKGLYDSFTDIYVISPTTVQTRSLDNDQKIHWVPLLQDVYGYDLGIHPAIFHDHRQRTHGNPIFTLMVASRELLSKFKLDKFHMFRRFLLVLSWLNARSVFSKDMDVIFNGFRVNEDDTVLLPSSEYLQLGKLLSLQKKIKFKLIVRFVGGLENSPLSRIEEKLLISRFNRHQLHSPGLRFSTETKEYSKYLEEKFTLPSNSIGVTYFPVHLPFKGKKCEGTLRKVGIVGSPREEKGLKHYLEIASVVLIETDWKFSLQIRSEDSQAFQNLAEVYSNRLTLFDRNLNENLFQETMSGLNALILPYDPDAYVMRNSAMLSTAIEYEVPIIVLEGSALANVVAEHGIGFTYNNPKEIPGLLNSLQNIHVKNTFETNKQEFVEQVERQWVELIQK
jgi:hypothetical protein